MKEDFSFIPGESFNGAIARWAPVNGVERMIDITHVAGAERAHRANAARADPVSIQALASEMGVDAVELLARSTPLDGPDLGTRSRRIIHGVSVPTSLLEQRVRRFSPRSLATGPYHRALWDFRLLSVCTESWEYLRHRCGGGECGDLGWHHTPGVELCEHCMRDLADAPGEKVKRELHVPLGNVAGLIHHDPATRAATLALLPQELAALGASVVIDLIVRLLPVIQPGMPNLPFALASARPKPLARAVAEAWKIVADWPRGFLDFTGARAGSREKRHSDGNDGETKRFLQMKSLTGISPEVPALAAALRTSIDVAGPNAAELARVTTPIKVAAFKLARGTAEIASYRRAGALATIMVYDAGRVQPLLSTTEIDGLVLGIADRTTFAGASARLGISHHGIEQLVALNTLRLLRHPYFEVRYGARQIEKSSIDDLERDLSEGAAGFPLTCTLPLDEAVKAIGGRMKPWGPALNALLDPIRSGAAPTIPFRVVTGDAPLARRILVEDSAKAVLMGMTFTPPTWSTVTFGTKMSKGDAEETLNTGPKQIGEILAGFATVPGSHVLAIPVSTVCELAEKHISSSELAARRGVTVQRAFQDARRVKSIPLLGAAGFCREATERHYFSPQARQTPVDDDIAPPT